jgi:hypothetical protein
MTATLKVSFTEMKDALASFLGISRTLGDWHANDTSDANLFIRAALRSVYSAHPWSFLRTDYTLVTSAPYETGTVAVVDGTATLTGGTWPTWAAYGWLYIGDIAYEVASRTNGSILVLDDSSLDVASTQYVLRRFAYEMPTDFAGFDGPLVYAPGESMQQVEVVKTSLHRIRRLYQQRDVQQADEPCQYALFTQSVLQTAGELRSIALYTPADDVYHLTAERYIIPNDIDGTNQYPSGGALYGEMFLEAVLAQAEQKKLRIANGPHTQAFNIELGKAIQNDKMLAAPDTLGPFVEDGGDTGRNPFYNPGYVLYEGHDIFG